MPVPGACSSTTAVRSLVEQQESTLQAATKPTSTPTPTAATPSSAGTGTPGCCAARSSAARGTEVRQPLGELGIAVGGGGDAPHGNRDFVLTKERVAAVRCYFRENDPLFIRANLTKLREGTLKPLVVGDTVKAARRCQEGENKVGGHGVVVAVLPHFFYDIKYVGGTEHRVDACFVEKVQLGSRKRKTGSSRCRACHSFTSECTCEEAQEQAAAVAAVAAAATKTMFLSAGARSGPSPAVVATVAAAAAATAAPCQREAEQVHPRKRPRSTTAGSQEATEDARPQSQKKQGVGLAGGAAPPVVSDKSGVSSGEIALGSGSGSSRRSGVEAEAEAPAGPGMDVEDDRAGVQSIAANDIHGGGGEGAALDELPDGNQTRDPKTTPRELGKLGGAEDSEAVWVEREEAAGGVLEAFPRGRRDAGVAEGVNGESRASSPSRDTVAGSGSDNRRNPGGDPSSLADRDEWRPKKGDLVEVERRMTPGVNKPGGTGSVVKVNATTGEVDVRYMVEGYWERGIDPVYIRPATLNLNRKRPTLGRCEHCGSLRVDCRQECDFFTAPPPRFSGSSTEGSGREGGLAESVARRERRRQQARVRKRERHRQRRRDRRTRPSQDGGKADDGAGRHSGSGQRRRRHLPEDYDEEGDPVGGSSQEETEVRSDSSSDSDALSRGVGRHRRNGATRRLVDSSSSSGGGRGGGSDSGGGMVDSEGRERWGLVGLSDMSDVGSGRDDSDVEILHVQRRPGRRSGRSRTSSRSSSSSRRRSHRVSNVGGSETSEGEQDREFDWAGTRPLGRDCGRIAPQASARGGDDQGQDAGGDGAADDARFLQPEGKEDELPPDIPDPTRGVQNREELKDELVGALEELEGDELAELRDDVENETGLEKFAAAVRRRMESATAPGAVGANADAALQALQDLTNRRDRTRKKLDGADATFRRLGRLSKSWRDGKKGENAGLRLDRITRSVIAADMAIRDCERLASGVDESSSSPPSGDGGSDVAGLSSGSSDDFDLGLSLSRRQKHQQEATARRRPVGRGSGTGGGGGGAARSASAGRTAASVSRGGGHPSKKRSRPRMQQGHGQGQGRASSNGQEGGRRARGAAPRPRVGDSSSAFGDCSGWDNVGGEGREQLGEEEEKEGEGEGRVPGLDYGMAVAGSSDETIGGSYDDGRSSRGTSLSRSGSSSSSSSFYRSPSPLPTSSRDGHSAARPQRSGRDSGRSGRSGSRAKGSARSGGWGGGGGGRGVGRAHHSRPSSSKHRDRRRGTGHRSTGGGGGGGSWGQSRRGRSVGNPGTGTGSTFFESAAWAGPRYAVNGRALQREQYQERLDQQLARGGPQADQPRGAPYGAGLPAALRGRDANAPQVERGATRHVGRQDAERRGGSGRREVDHPGARPLPTLVDCLVSDPRRGALKFETLFTKTRGATTAAIGMNGDDRRLEANGFDTCFVAGDPAHGNVGGSELVRALEALPQRMADLEELAITHNLHEEAESVAKECCKTMAVIGAKLRGAFDLSSRSPENPSPVPPIASGGGAQLQPQSQPQQWQQTSPGRRDASGGVPVAAATAAAVRRLAEACGPGRGGDGHDGDGHGCGREFPGLSLTAAALLAEKSERRGVSTRGTAALVGACTALHVHLLEWLTLVALEEGGDGHDSALPGAAAAVAEAGRRERVARPSEGIRDFLVGFARCVLLDLLFLFEKRRPAPGARRRGVSRREGEEEALSKDPSAELLSAVMDTLDGTRLDDKRAPGPAAKVNVPGLASPLVGFWGVFFQVVSGWPSAFHQVPGNSGGGGEHGSLGGWTGGGLPSEQVWKVLVHACHLDLATRRGLEDNGDGGGNGGTPEEALAQAAARQLRQRDVSRALWACVRLLLAASPFAPEFGGGGGGATNGGQAAAIAATAKATLAAASKQGRRSAASSTPAVLPPPVTAAPECYTAPGAAARVLLERVLALARFRAPEAEAGGVVERLWEGVQRISGTLCADVAAAAASAAGDATRTAVVGAKEGRDGRNASSTGADRTPEGREERRERSARRLSRQPTSSRPMASADLGRLLSAAVEAWCIPAAHGTCHLPAAVLKGSGTAASLRLGRSWLRHDGQEGEGDYEGLSLLISLMTEEHVARLPMGLKRNKLANNLRKAKYSPPSGTSAARLWDEDDVLCLAPWRVLLGIALGAARTGAKMVALAADLLVKAAAVRPRSVAVETPRDRSIALVAPAAAALCLTLSRSSCDHGGGGGGGTGSCSSVRATLYVVLADCMRGALELTTMVLDGASKLGQAMNPERLERPRAVIGLAASCILVALRHLGPRSLSSTPQSGEVAGTTPDGGAGPAPLVAARSATAAAAVFMEVLGRALDPRFSKHLGSAALTTVMSAVLHCWPPPPPSSAGADGSSGGGPAVVAPAAEVGAAGAGQRGYAMGWWCVDPDGSPRSSSSGGGGGAGAGGGADEPGRSRTGKAAQPGQEDVLEDEWGSFNFLDDPELNAILSGGAVSQPSEQQQQQQQQQQVAAAAAAAAAVAAVEEEQHKTWRSLADGAQTHILPHLHEILKTTYTIARFAQGSSSSSFSSASSSSSFTHRRNCSAATSATSSSSSTARGVPPRVATVAAATAAGVGASSSSSSSAATLSSIESSRVDAGILLELHAAAALVALHGSSSSSGGSSRRGGGAGGGGGSSGSVGGEPCFAFSAVREKYLEVHRMAHNPLVPQQRLVAAAFFCLVLGSATANGANGGDNDSSSQIPSGIETNPGGGRCPPRPPRLARPLLEALRGREWEVLQLWMQAALDPLVFPVSQRRHRLSRRGGGGGDGRGATREPSDIVREHFEGFTRCLSAAFGGVGGGGGGGGGSSRVDGTQDRPPPLDADVAGVFEKRLVRFEPAQLAALSSEEARVLERVLDLQSVVAHCGGLWSSAVGFSGPERLSHGDKKRVKDRVLKLVHNSIKSVGRFLQEVFPREARQSLAAGSGRQGSSSSSGNNRSRGRRSGSGLPSPRYGLAFRRLYGHAAYSFAAFVLRMCGGGMLKGLPLRELVETFFEGVAGGVAGANGASPSAPHAELTALAVTHVSDLLYGFSETILTMNPVADWIKNIIDHAIHGKPRPLPSSQSSAAAASSSAPLPAANATANESDASAPLLASLASALRGDLAYPGHRGGPVQPRADDAYSGLIAAAALAPPPCRDPTLRQKRRAGLRREMLGDRKLRVARFLMETATAGRTPQGRGDNGAAGVAAAAATAAGTEQRYVEQQQQQQRQQAAVSVRKARRLLALSTGLFGRRRMGADAGGGGSSSGLISHGPRPALSFAEDILPLVRPAYSLLGEALLGDAGLARRLAPEAVAVASALAGAGLDHAPRGREGRAEVERRAARCFAEAVVLAVSTHLGMVLASVWPASPAADGGIGGGSTSEGSGLAELGPRESHLEQLLERLGAWKCHGGEGRGWPHSSLPSAMEISSPGKAGGGQGTHTVDDGTPLPELLKEVENMVTDLRHVGAGGETGEEMQRLLDDVLATRLEACRAYFNQGPGGGGLRSTTAAV
eukprot:g12719.t1